MSNVDNNLEVTFDRKSVAVEVNMSLDVNISEPDEFNCNELHNYIKEAAARKGINNFEYHVDTISGKGVNFIANLFRVTIKDEEDAKNTASVIVKILINTAMPEIFHELHKKEVVVYENILPKFTKIQESLNEENKVFFPACVFANTEDGKEVLVLEDMRERGFAMTNKVAKFEQLDIKEVQLVVKELAKFHALSFIYKNQDPESFRNLKSTFNDLIFNNKSLNKPEYKKYYLESFGMSLKVVEDAGARKSLEFISSKLIEALRFYIEPKKHNVLCHGDCWINNVLFKQSETGDQLCFLDFQTLRYANPATDIINFLYICTDSNFRFQNFDFLLEIYYESLQTFANLFDIDINSIYPKEQLDVDVKNMLPYGLLVALVELRIVTGTSEDIDALRGSTLALNVLESPNGNELFKVRVNDVVREATRHGSIIKLIDEIKTTLY